MIGYHTALAYHGKLNSLRNDYIFLNKGTSPPVFAFRNLEFKAVSYPINLIKHNKESYGVETKDHLGHKILVTNLERTLVDVLDRPTLLGDWEEIWKSLESIGYLDVDKVIHYLFLLRNKTTIAKVGFFLESHKEEFQISENKLDKMLKHCPMKPLYINKQSKQPYELISRWNIIVPESIINKVWEEPYGDIVRNINKRIRRNRFSSRNS